MKLTEEQIEQLWPSVPEWERLDEKWIQRKYRFTDFGSAIRFVNQTAVLAETANHHPFISIDYRVVTLKLSSWSAGGLTQLDFDLAKQFDKVAQPEESQ